TTCPACGREIQFPEYFYGSEVGCPAPGCGRPVQFPNADGTMPVKQAPAPDPARPEPAAEYYLRKPDDPDLVVGPLPRERLRQMTAQNKLQRTDELSTDRRKWQPAGERDPGLFAKDKFVCRTCGAVVTGDGDQCAACAGGAADDGSGTYGVSTARNLRARSLTPRLE